MGFLEEGVCLCWVQLCAQDEVGGDGEAKVIPLGPTVHLQVFSKIFCGLDFRGVDTGGA